MHGHIDRRLVPVDYSIEELTPSQRSALTLLVTEYFKAGFPDPGLALFSTAENDEIRQCAGRDPLV